MRQLEDGLEREVRSTLVAIILSLLPRYHGTDPSISGVQIGTGASEREMSSVDRSDPVVTSKITSQSPVTVLGGSLQNLILDTLNQSSDDLYCVNAQGDLILDI